MYRDRIRDRARDLVYARVGDGQPVAVTSQRQSFQLAYIEAYDLREVFGRRVNRYGDGPWEPPPEELLEELMTETTAPETWVSRGGPAGLCHVRHGWMIVYQTPKNQWHVRETLGQVLLTMIGDSREREKRRLLSRLRGENPPPKAPASR